MAARGSVDHKRLDKGRAAISSDEKMNQQDAWNMVVVRVKPSYLREENLDLVSIFSIMQRTPPHICHRPYESNSLPSLTRRLNIPGPVNSQSKRFGWLWLGGDPGR